MNRDHPLDQIERRLREQANQLLRSHGPRPPTAALLAEHRRRTRVRRMTRIVCCAVGVLMLLGVAGVLGGLWPENQLADQPPAAKVGGSTVPDANETDEHQPGSRPFNDSPKEPSPGEPVLTLVSQAKGDANRPLAFPVFIAVPEGDKKRVIAAGIYVPEHTREVDLSDLSPAEQHAVRQVLDMPEDQIPRGPI